MMDFYDLAGADPRHRFSPYCWRVRLALAHKGYEEGVEFEARPWRFSDRASLPGAPATRTVPVLVDGGEAVAGSTEIAFHLEDVHGHGPSLFGGPAGEAHALFHIGWADTVLIPALFPLLAADIFDVLAPQDREYFRRTREQRLGTTLEASRQAREQKLPGVRKTLEPIRQVLKHQAFLGGEEPSYADYAVFGAFQWARCVSDLPLLEESDPVAGWRDLVLDLFGGLARQAITFREARKPAGSAEAAE